MGVRHCVEILSASVSPANAYKMDKHCVSYVGSTRKSRTNWQHMGIATDKGDGGLLPLQQIIMTFPDNMLFIAVPQVGWQPSTMENMVFSDILVFPAYNCPSRLQRVTSFASCNSPPPISGQSGIAPLGPRRGPDRAQNRVRETSVYSCFGV